MRKLAWLALPVIAIAIWLAVRTRTTTSAPTTAVVPPSATAPTTAPSGVERTTPPRSDATPGATAPGVPAHETGSSASPGAAPVAGTTPTTSPTTPTRTAPPVLPPAAGSASTDPDAPAGKFNDKTGWSDPSVVKQLNKEFMPLASECIDQAKARKRGLQGMLSFTMVIAPTENGRAIVSSLKVRPDNQIEDPELFECVRESSFALEGLKAPHDFDITMPIKPDDPG